MVTNVPPLDCVPSATYINNFTTCAKNETLMTMTRTHNELLVQGLYTLQYNTPNIHIILLNQTRAMNHLMFYKSIQGIFYNFNHI